ncbi:exonuclease domain-containing protein [Haloimpatiens sp. FM7315]|uniref:exonuclease domain-containing protein n=1 Tax=Haloimpatiens sp. FM7315 TaxID=3298609 RepID=UPI00370A3F01
MNFVIFDMEFNNYNRELFDRSKSSDINAQCPNEIIEIGAMKLDKDLNVIDNLKLYIKPVIYRHINPVVAGMTGITEEQLNKGVDFCTAIEKFRIFSGENMIICSWAKDDIIELIRNANFHKYKNLSWIDKYIDIQDYCTKALGEKNCLSLKRALSKLNIDFNEEELHDALYDTEFTVEVFKKIYHMRDLKEYIVENIHAMPAITVTNASEVHIEEECIKLHCPKCRKKVKMKYPFKFLDWRFISIGYCEKCGCNFLEEVVVKKNITGKKTYIIKQKILREDRYLEIMDKYKIIS